MNLSINALRRRRRSLLRFVRADNDIVDLPEPGLGPDHAVDALELRGVVRVAVMQLSEKHRAVIVLRLFHDYSTRETADALGVPEGTVLSRLSRAMRELEIRLEPYVRRGAVFAGKGA
jgi:RNA polymerase sigma-70 factor (ECF subfamily)